MIASPIRDAVRSGMVATFTATTAGYWLPGIGLPRLDFATLNGNLIVPESASASFSWSIGLLHMFGLGMLLAFLFSVYVERHLPGPGWIRGILWGLVLGIVASLTVLPLLLYGAGPLGLDWDRAMPLALAIWYLTWGGTLGLVSSRSD